MKQFVNRIVSKLLYSCMRSSQKKNEPISSESGFVGHEIFLLFSFSRFFSNWHACYPHLNARAIHHFAFSVVLLSWLFSFAWLLASFISLCGSRQLSGSWAKQILISINKMYPSEFLGAVHSFLEVCWLTASLFSRPYFLSCYFPVLFYA